MWLVNFVYLVGFPGKNAILIDQTRINYSSVRLSRFVVPCLGSIMTRLEASTFSRKTKWTRMTKILSTRKRKSNQEKKSVIIPHFSSFSAHPHCGTCMAGCLKCWSILRWNSWKCSCISECGKGGFYLLLIYLIWLNLVATRPTANTQVYIDSSVTGLLAQ
jgi:hypothetical protein